MKKKLFSMTLMAVAVLALIACGKKNKVEDPDLYTYNGAFTLSPSTFDPLNYKSTTDSVPLDYTTNSFYEFSYNADGTGFELVPVMAAADPVDVTATYAVDNKYGIEEETANYAFRIALNPDAKWENGDPITADDYVYTLKQLLDPTVQKYRASNYYKGATVIANAQAYFYSGQSGVGQATLAYEHWADADKSVITFVWNETNAIYDYIMTNYASNVGTDSYPTVGHLCAALGYAGDPTDFEALAGKTYAEIEADADLSAMYALVDAFWSETEDEQLTYFESPYTMPVVEWDSVGLKKIDDYTIDIIYTGELVGFYQKYSIGLPLVYESLYESCKRQDATTGAWSTNYGTSVDTYMGYGPYKLTKYIVDQIMVFERNENWFGYTEKYADTYGTFVAEFDGQEHQQYQTDKVVLKYVKEISTREEMFNLGQLEVLGLNKTYYDTYKNSQRLYSATGAATFYGIILSDYESLVAREAVMNGYDYNDETAADYDGSTQQYNKTILSIKEFRQALCYAIDRSKLVSALYPGGTPAINLWSDLIIADPDNGTALNSFDSVKEAVCNFWGVEYGADKEFATLDAAYNAITGYDLAQAKELVNVAVQKAKELGLMGDNTIVKIDHCESSDNQTSQLWYQTFKANFEELVKGTALENKFEYVYQTNLGSDFGGAIQSGKADTSWGFGWSGGELDPYGLMEVYVDGSYNDPADAYQYDLWIDRSDRDHVVTINVDVDGDGELEEYSYSVTEWFYILNGMDDAPDGLDWSFSKVDGAIRAQAIAACTENILGEYTTIPMMNEGSVQLLSYKVNYGKESYMFGMGFGGIRYVTYNFNNGEWAKYIAKQSGKVLNYK